MKWFLGERFCLETQLRPDFVMGILRDHVGKIHWQEGDAIIGPEPLFEKLTMQGEKRFLLRPSTQLTRNRSRPLWECELEENDTGTRLNVCSHSGGSSVVVAIWIVGICADGVLRKVRELWWKDLPWFLGMGILLLFLSAAEYWPVERRAKRELQKILGGRYLKST